MRLAITIILFFATSFLHAQQPVYERLSVEDGLPSAEVYCVTQDHEGFIWFATSKGIARYDGLDFRTYTVKDGLPSNSIIDIYLDVFGKLWFSSFEGYLSCYSQGVITIHPLKDTIAALANNYFIDNIFIDSLNNLWFMPNSGLVYKTDNLGHIEKIETGKRNYTDYTFYFIDKSFGFIWGKPSVQNVFDKTDILVENDCYYVRWNNVKGAFRKNIHRINDSEYLVSFGKNVIHIKNKEIIAQTSFHNEIAGLFSDKSGNFWISVLYEGVYLYQNGNLNLQPEVILAGKSPTTVFQDNEGSYWLPTTEDGVYFIPSLKFKGYSHFGFGNYNILAIEHQDQNLYFSTYDKQVFRCEVQSNRINSIENIKLGDNRNYSIFDILQHSDGSLWFLGNHLYRMQNDAIQVIDTTMRAYMLSESKDKSLFVSTFGGFKEFYKGMIIENFTNKFRSSTQSIYCDTNNVVYLGTLDGLYIYKNGIFEYQGNKSPLLKNRIDDIKEFRGNLWLGTRGDGIIVKKNDQIIHITEREGLGSNFVNAIYPHNDSVIWIGTNKGLCRITACETDLFCYKIENFSKSDGLFSEEIKDLTQIDDCIWLGTSKGLISFKPALLEKHKSVSKVLIDSVLIDDKAVLFSNQYKLNYNQNNISIYFKTISFKSPKKIRYKYKLSGYDNQWIVTPNRHVRFPNLPPGEYVFQLTSAVDEGNWNQEHISIKFTISKHFTQTILFLVLVYLSVTAFVVGIILMIYYYLKKRIETERKLLDAEQKALRSQMNPHFLFNALNSIRRYILENETDAADNYLTSFASLMRMVLENSKSNTITLQTEIETMRLYLDLEKMRFDDSFSFKIYVDDTINILETRIAPMLIQPFLENAIWHGLAPKKTAGLLTLYLKQTENKDLICIIEDNGIGRVKASEIAKKRKEHKSTGLKNIEERIMLINKLFKADIKITITDLYNDKAEPKGTKVEILIPQMVFN